MKRARVDRVGRMFMTSHLYGVCSRTWVKVVILVASLSAFARPNEWCDQDEKTVYVTAPSKAHSRFLSRRQYTFRDPLK